MLNKIEFKKDSLRQTQGGDIKIGFTIQHIDMPDYLYTDPMGTRYYVVLVNADDYDERENISLPQQKEQTEGEKLRLRAVMLCKDKSFQEYFVGVTEEDTARHAVLTLCNIKSRAELAYNIKAQDRFRNMLERYKNWQAEQAYSDNLERI